MAKKTNQTQKVSRYACSLVYQNSKRTFLATVINSAHSEMEAFGMAVDYFKEDAKDYSLLLQSILKIDD